MCEGPIVSGFLGEAEGWRWIEGLMAIFTGVLWIACSLLVPETYAPVLLRIRAAKLSKLTGKVYVSKMDVNKERHTMAHQFKVALSRPWMLLFREPIVFLTSVYMAIVYGTLYMMFPAFPIVFQASKGWSPGEAGLAFLGITVGMVFAVAYAMFDNIRYAKVAEEHNGMAPPEARLPMAIVGSAFIPIGLFWFAWTNGNNVHWIVPIIGSAFFAVGIVLVFLSLLNYLIDSCKFRRSTPGSKHSIIRQRTDTILFQTSFSPPQSWPRTPFCGLSSAPPSRSSQSKCTRTWAFTGRLRYPPSSRWRAYHFPSSSTYMAPKSVPSASSPPRLPGSSKRCAATLAPKIPRQRRTRPWRRSSVETGWRSWSNQ